MIDTAIPAPVSAAPASSETSAAPVAPETSLPQIDMGSIQTQEDADRLISQLSSAEMDQIISGKSVEEVLAARSPKPQAATTPVPPQTPAPEAKPEGTPADDPNAKTEEAPELTADILAEAHPALQALHEENIKLLEQIEQMESAQQQPSKSKYADDPFIRMREQMLESGNIEVPVVVDFERDLGLNLKNEITTLLADENMTEDQIVSSIYNKVLAFQKEGNSRLVGNLNAARSAWEGIGEKRATFRTELQEFCKTIPEAKTSADPLIIRSPDGGRTLNEAHPASAFAKWVAEAASAGLITDEQVERYGWEWAYTTWKSATKGHNAHMNDVRKSAVADRLAAQRALRDSVTSRMQAKTLGLPSNASSTQSGQFYGFSLDWIKASPQNALQAQAKWRAEGNAKAENELLALLTRNP